MDRLIASQVFVQVVESGSLTQAAERLAMSHAMVSRYLQAMETWLGVRLLHRTTRKLALTDAGESALHSCRMLLALAQEMSAQTQEKNLEPAGRLRIAAPVSFAEAQLTDVLSHFMQQFPKIELELVVSDKTVNLVDERIDLAIRISNALDSGLISRRLGDCVSLLVASPGYLRQYGEPETALDLLQHRMLTHQFVGKSLLELRQQDRHFPLHLQPVFCSNETAVLRRAAVAGLGIAMLPAYYLKQQLAQGELMVVLKDYQTEVLGIHAVYLSRRHQPLALRSLVDYLAQHITPGMPAWASREFRATPESLLLQRGKGEPSPGKRRATPRE